MRRGQAALSEFRLAKLLARLRRCVPGIHSVSAHYQYLIDSTAPLGEEQARRLDALLQATAGEGGAAAATARFLIFPRPGTISPWASKATDIAHACGFAEVRRI